MLTSRALREHLTRSAGAWTVSFPTHAIVLRALQREVGPTAPAIEEGLARASLGTLLAALLGIRHRVDRARTVGRIHRRGNAKLLALWPDGITPYGHRFAR